MDKRILEANQKIYATKAQQEMMLLQKAAEHELATQCLQMRGQVERKSGLVILIHYSFILGAEERARAGFCCRKEPTRAGRARCK
jgi:hypothetical protein